MLHNCEPRAGWRPWRRRHRAEGLKVPVCAFSGFPSGAISQHDTNDLVVWSPDPLRRMLIEVPQLIRVPLCI